jgi:hypothetical protein
MIFRVNFGFHGRSFGAPAPVSKLAVGTDLGRSITQQARQNKPRTGPKDIRADRDPAGFASAGSGAYLVGAEPIGQIS